MATYSVSVSVMPKLGILDPQGKAVEGSLPELGITNVRNVHVGRRVDFDVEASSSDEARAVATHAAKELFANPLIESWQIDLVAPVPMAEDAGR